MDLNISLKDEKKKKGSGRRRKNSMFSERKANPAGAVVSVVIAAVVLLAFFILIFLSFQSGGKSGFASGCIGMMMMCASIGGFVTAVLSFRQKEISLQYPLIGVIGNGILILVYGIIYLSGTGFF